jgi:CheY-like chemotaxis protein
MAKKRSPELRILWIEDQLVQTQAGVDQVRFLLNAELRREIAIIEAAWVDKAEEHLRELRGHPPDLIVLDIMLPRTEEAFNSEPRDVDMNAGFVIWHRLRRQQEWGAALAAVPILVVTAMARPLFRPLMEGDVALSWVEKPIGPSALANEALALLSRSGGC